MRLVLLAEVRYDGGTKPIYVNPDAVLFLRPATEGTFIALGHDGLVVREDPLEVRRLLERAGGVVVE